MGVIKRLMEWKGVEKGSWAVGGGCREMLLLLKKVRRSLVAQTPIQGTYSYTVFCLISLHFKSIAKMACIYDIELLKLIIDDYNNYFLLNMF